jgi:hypothetical protein
LLNMVTNVLDLYVLIYLAQENETFGALILL